MWALLLVVGGLICFAGVMIGEKATRGPYANQEEADEAHGRIVQMWGLIAVGIVFLIASGWTGQMR
jgi:hypothetical protein